MRIIITKHARNRIIRRKIQEYEVVEALNYPEQIKKRHGRYLFQKKLERGTIEACCERTESNIKVITVYWLK
ncbi:MAG: DUF4258 domain-containing protein [Nanoarchaeota archaeon]|nr:DUF4258 domain-containing protein [Nanoarchaeota archaeon]